MCPLQTCLFKFGCQREKVWCEVSQLSVLHVISYDWDQPAARELKVITVNKQIHNTVHHINNLIFHSKHWEEFFFRLRSFRKVTYSVPVIRRGTAFRTTSGPMLSTALPTARSSSPEKGNWGVARRSLRDCRLWRSHTDNKLPRKQTKTKEKKIIITLNYNGF